MSEEAQSFWSRAIKTLQSAKAILPSDPDGSCSISYYAAFYAVSALFALKGMTFTKHSAVRSAVHRDLVKSGDWSTEMGAAYSSLYELRFIASYGGSNHVSEEQSEKAITAARRILQAVHEMHPEDFPLPDDNELRQ